jgi:hypothetical protein
MTTNDESLISAHRTRSNRRPAVEPAIVAEIEAVLEQVVDGEQ